jgi:tRNA A37 threonylcarbamoyladenosine modification protein TsaB
VRALIALETSTRVGSVALRVDGETFEARLAGERAHASDLLPELERLLADHACALESLDAIARWQKLRLFR